MPWVTLKVLVEQTGFARRTLQYIRQREPGVLITRAGSSGVEYLQPDCAQSLFKRERDSAKKDAEGGKSDADKQASQLLLRKLTAETAAVELKVAKELGAVIDTTAHEDIVGEVCDRMRAVLINLPGNYGHVLEEAGLEAVQARLILEGMADKLMKTLSGVSDDMEDPGQDDGEERDAA